MKRYLLALFGLLLTGLAVAALGSQRERDPVYSVAEVRAGLDRDPGAWVDRIVRVRAIPTSGRCFMTVSLHRPACAKWQPALLDTDLTGTAEPLPLVDEGAPTLLALLHRLPLLRDVAPGPRIPHWDTPGVYRVLIRAMPCPIPAGMSCYEAVLRDAGP